jgi:hypothetical protein
MKKITLDLREEEHAVPSVVPKQQYQVKDYWAHSKKLSWQPEYTPHLSDHLIGYVNNVLRLSDIIITVASQNCNTEFENVMIKLLSH